MQAANHRINPFGKELRAVVKLPKLWELYGSNPKLRKKLEEYNA